MDLALNNQQTTLTNFKQTRVENEGKEQIRQKSSLAINFKGIFTVKKSGIKENENKS